MMKYMVLSMLAVLGSAIMLSFFVAASAFAQDAPYSEEYMQQHDGGDRAEYLQEMESSDPWFYVPPVNDASLSTTTDNNIPAN
jgi:hypothetical protein